MTSIDILQQRVPTTTCARCRKLFQPGDRVVPCNIVQKIGRNPEARAEMGAFFSDSFELVHADCRDTSLSGRVVLV